MIHFSVLRRHIHHTKTFVPPSRGMGSSSLCLIALLALFLQWGTKRSRQSAYKNRNPFNFTSQILYFKPFQLFVAQTRQRLQKLADWCCSLMQQDYEKHSAGFLPSLQQQGRASRAHLSGDHWTSGNYSKQWGDNGHYLYFTYLLPSLCTIHCAALFKTGHLLRQRQYLIH